MQFKGTVSKILEKNGRSAKGPWTLYNVVLATEAGEVVIGFGFDKPKVREGSVVSMEAAENAKGYWEADKNSVQVLKEEGGGASDTKTVSNGVAAVDQRQRSIITQSSYGYAVSIVDTLLANDLIKLPPAKSKANDSYDLYMEVLDRVAQRIFNISATGLQVEEQPEEDNTEDSGEYDPLA